MKIYKQSDKTTSKVYVGGSSENKFEFIGKIYILEKDEEEIRQISFEEIINFVGLIELPE